MRAFLILAMISVVVHMVYSKGEMIAPEEMMEECKKSSGFQGTLSSIKMEDTPKPAKCFLSCIMEKKGVLQKDGTIDKEKAKEVVMKEYPELKDKIFKVIDECIKEVKPSKELCETAYKYAVCRRSKLAESA